jgi:MFS family permease
MDRKYTSGWHKVILIIALLALNIVEQAASVISGAIPQMAQSFPKIPEVQIELVTTIVSMFVTIFVLVSGFLTKKVGQKTIAVTGLLIASVSSIIPAFSNNFTVIMISRAIFGIGIGLANPLAISLIGEFFKGDTLANLMGWRSAIAGAGVAIMTFLAGQLLQISWHASYLVYLLFIPTLLLFIFFVPSPEKYGLKVNKAEDKPKDTTNDEKKHSIWPVIGFGLLLFAYFACIMVLFVKIATFLVDTKIGTPTQASTVLSVSQICQLVGGALFGVAYKHLKEFVFPIGLLISGLSMVGIATASNVTIVMVWSVVSGFFGGLAIPYIFTRVAQLSNTKEAPLNNAICLVGSNMGSFLAPYVGQFFGPTATMSIRNAGIVLLIITAIVFVIYLVDRAKQKKKLTHNF